MCKSLRVNWNFVQSREGTCLHALGLRYTHNMTIFGGQGPKPGAKSAEDVCGSVSSNGSSGGCVCETRTKWQRPADFQVSRSPPTRIAQNESKERVRYSTSHTHTHTHTLKRTGNYIYRGTAVTQWLRFYATNRKVAGSIPACVIEIFHWHKILPIALWPWGRLSL